MKSGKNLKLIIVMILIAAALAIMTGCTTFDNFKHTFFDEGDNETEKTLHIGVFEPQTGKYAGEGLAEIKGIELANSIYNSVNGYKVELIKVDTQSSTVAAETAIQGLIEMDPVAIIGSEGEASSLVASNYIKKAQIPTITPSATNPLITQNNDYYFRACITESQMGAAVAEYAYKELKSRKIGIAVGINDTAATTLMDGFDDQIKTYVKKRKKAVPLEKSIEFSEEEMNKLVKDMTKADVDVMFIPQGTEIMDQFFTLVEKNGLTDVTYIGGKSWGGSDFVEMMKNHPDIKVAFPYDTVLGTDNENSTEEAERFTILYHNKYGADEDPNHFAALGYDSYLILINALYNSKDLDGQSVRDAIAELSGITGTTGSFSFDENGNTVRAVTLSTIKSGKISSIYVSKDTAKTKEIDTQSEQEGESQADKTDGDSDKEDNEDK